MHFNYNHNVSKSIIAYWCFKVSTFLTNNSPDLYVLTLCIVLRKKGHVFSTPPRNISDSNGNYRRYNFQAFANISAKFPEILNFATLKLTVSVCCHGSGEWGGKARDMVQPAVSIWPADSRRGRHHDVACSHHNGEAVPWTCAPRVGHLARTCYLPSWQVSRATIIGFY